eukprot:snap_masked-scaffold_23-processed-gene-4.19-mRNA-1 protein AED:0.11 eAED:0.13 QI:0/-1/0/1/-1/1/1/0/217
MPTTRSQSKKQKVEEDSTNKTTSISDPTPKLEKKLTEAEPPLNSETKVESFYDFKLNNLEETEEIDFSTYKGKVCVLVNVASKCGLTKGSYEGLLDLDSKFKQKGLEILAFPCNQFGKQEPGTKETIRKFMDNKGVKFQVFTKIDVNGKKENEIWSWLKEAKQDQDGKKRIKWNFTKFLVDKNGAVVSRFEPKQKISEMVSKVEELLEQPAPKAGKL